MSSRPEDPSAGSLPLHVVEYVRNTQSPSRRKQTMCPISPPTVASTPRTEYQGSV